MKFPVSKVIECDKNKYQISMIMIKYNKKLEEYPQLLVEYKPRDREKKLKIILSNVLNGKIPYIDPESELKPEGE